MVVAAEYNAKIISNAFLVNVFMGFASILMVMLIKVIMRFLNNPVNIIYIDSIVEKHYSAYNFMKTDR